MCTSDDNASSSENTCKRLKTKKNEVEIERKMCARIDITPFIGLN